MRTTTLQWARFYVHEKKWSVIPLKHQGKEPDFNVISSTWKPYTERFPTDGELEYWFGGDTHRNIGVVTGSISSLIVVDFDDEVSAEEFIQATKETSNPLIGHAVKTGNGLHLYFHCTENVRTSSFLLNDKRHHIKAYNSYVVAPPSLHPSGLYYEWQTFVDVNHSETNHAELVDFLIHNVGVEFTTAGRVDRPLNWASELCQEISQGGRNESAAQLCGLLINKFPYDPGFIHGIMKAWNEYYCVPPLPDNELDNLVKNEYLRYGPKEPVRK